MLLRKVKLNIILQYFENQKLKIENGQLVVLTFCFQFPLPKSQAIQNSHLTKQFMCNKLQETVLLPGEIQNTEKPFFDFRINEKQNCQPTKNTCYGKGEGKTDNYYMRAFTNHFSVRDLGIFPVWTLPETEINNFNNFTNSFRTTINFTLELSSKQIVFLDTEVFKGPRFIQTHYETS